MRIGRAIPLLAMACVMLLASCNRAGFAMSEFQPKGDGGQGTKILLTEAPGGGVIVNPSWAGPEYTYTTTASVGYGLSGSIRGPSYWYSGAEWVFWGKVELPQATFDSDKDSPLTFKMVKDKGLVYVRGRGTVTQKSGKVTRLGQ